MTATADFDTIRAALGFQTEAEREEQRAAEREARRTRTAQRDADVRAARNLRRSQSLAKNRPYGNGPRIARSA